MQYSNTAFKRILCCFSYLAHSYSVFSQTVAVYVILKSALIPERNLLEFISVDWGDTYNQLYTRLDSGSVDLLNHLTPLSSAKSLFHTVAEHTASEPY